MCMRRIRNKNSFFRFLCFHRRNENQNKERKVSFNFSCQEKSNNILIYAFCFWQRYLIIFITISYGNRINRKKKFSMNIPNIRARFLQNYLLCYYTPSHLISIDCFSVGCLLIDRYKSKLHQKLKLTILRCRTLTLLTFYIGRAFFC